MVSTSKLVSEFIFHFWRLFEQLLDPEKVAPSVVDVKVFVFNWSCKKL